MESLRTNASIGRRLRELRMERGLQQAEVARQLGVSAAYLNLIEKGKRTVQLPLLWAALRLLSVDVETFMASLGEARVDEGLAQLLDEPLVRSLGLTAEDVANFSTEPKMAATIAALFNLYKHTRGQLEAVLQREAQVAGRRGRRVEGGVEAAAGERIAEAIPAGYTPLDEVTDFLEHHKNWFPELEEETRRLRRDHDLGRRIASDAMIKMLEGEYGIAVRWAAPRAGTVIRRFDPATSTLTLAPQLADKPLRFQLASTIGLRVLEQGHLHERLASEWRPKHAETARLIKVHLANYFGGALLLPYNDFHREVERARYDVEQLAQLFEVTYEAAAHRVCNLSDPRRPGLPMHFLRVDVAGNISKRYSATGLRLGQSTGGCPKWAVHAAFLNPFAVTRQFSQMPDGTTYFCFARVQGQAQAGSVVRGTTYSIGLGTHAENAKHLAYADDFPIADVARLAVPIGTSCRFCERTDCNQRAAPSYKFAFVVDENIKKENLFSPLMEDDKK